MPGQWLSVHWLCSLQQNTSVNMQDQFQSCCCLSQGSMHITCWLLYGCWQDVTHPPFKYHFSKWLFTLSLRKYHNKYLKQLQSRSVYVILLPYWRAYSKCPVVEWDRKLSDAHRGCSGSWLRCLSDPHKYTYTIIITSGVLFATAVAFILKNMIIKSLSWYCYLLTYDIMSSVFFSLL